MAELKRTSHARWEGDLRNGKGNVALGSGLFEGPYSFASRFENAHATNPEDLLAAAHAACFAMAASNGLAKAGHTVTSFEVNATVTLSPAEGAITGIALDAAGVVPGIDDAEFQRVVEEAKRTCPVSKALAAVPISLTARLRSS